VTQTQTEAAGVTLRKHPQDKSAGGKGRAAARRSGECSRDGNSAGFYGGGTTRRVTEHRPHGPWADRAARVQQKKLLQE